MITNSVYIGGPQINWLPRILTSVAECSINDENYCTFCIQTNEEKAINKLKKALTGIGYKVSVFVVSEVLAGDEDEDDEVINLYYIKVSWDDNVSLKFLQKEGKDKYVH